MNREETIFNVAQIFNLPYRRVALGSALNTLTALELSRTLQITNLRYGRVQLCATSAAMSQNRIS